MEYVDIEPETKENFINEKQYNSKLDNIDCLFIISSSNDSIKFEIKPLQKLTIFLSNYYSLYNNIISFI